MLESFISNPELKKYINSYEANQNIFLEGDEPEDMYVLLSGLLDVLKGDKKIAEMSDRGAIFGEMSFLLGAKRTATIRAATDVEAIRIPKEELREFLDKFPELCQETSKLLAKRLDRASQVLFGLKETCDQIPDAVLLTNKEGNIISWNNAAKNLYGRDWRQISTRSIEDLYEDTEAYRNFLKEVREKYSATENILKINHPQKGTRYISTSMTVLYDAHHNYQGTLSIGRDVTSTENMKRKIRRAWFWLIPSIILLVLMAGATLYGYPYFIKGYQGIDIPKRELRNQMAKDFLLLKSLVLDNVERGEPSQNKQVLKEFLKVEGADQSPYTGLVLLNKQKKVIDAFSIKDDADASQLIGRSYAHINFQGGTDSYHKVLTLYRKEKSKPGSHKSVEVAFELEKGRHLVGWLIFQMNMDLLNNAYGLDEEGLKELRFSRTD